MFPAKLPMVAKKSPNRMKIPYNSTRKPINGQRRSIRITPLVNAAVPFSFGRRVKKSTVLGSPMIRARPRTKSIWWWVSRLDYARGLYAIHYPWPASEMLADGLL